jgi:hypothetical protein
MEFFVDKYIIEPSTTQRSNNMTKSQIYAIRAQTHSAMTNAKKNKVAYSPLIRMEWKKYGYIPVPAYNVS